MSSHVTMIWPSADLRLFLGAVHAHAVSRAYRSIRTEMKAPDGVAVAVGCGRIRIPPDGSAGRRPSSEKSCSSGQMRQLIGLYLCRFGSLSRVSKSKLTSRCHSCAPHPTGGDSEEAGGESWRNKGQINFFSSSQRGSSRLQFVDMAVFVSGGAHWGAEWHTEIGGFRM